MNLYFLLFTLLFILFSGCATDINGVHNHHNKDIPTPGVIGDIIANYNEEPDEIGAELDLPAMALDEEKELVAIRGDGKTSYDDDMALSYHPKHFNFWKNYFVDSSKGRERFVRQLSRGEKYRILIQDIFKEHGLPKDLFYVGLIESGYALTVKSHASAVGPWQFIKGTAKRYGLKVNDVIDERKNIHKATHAAAAYFRDLYNIFGSWELALCAYNAGEYRIINAIRKGGTRDYKTLVTKRLIPKETIYYVPKMAAARDISKKREKIGLSIPQVEIHESHFYARASFVDMNKNFSLPQVARYTKARIKDLELLNPDLNNKPIGASDKNKIQIVIPHYVKRSEVDSVVAVNIKENFVKTQIILKNNKSNVAPSHKIVSYKIRKGDNLIKIAKKFKTSPTELKKINNMSSDKVLIGRVLKIRTNKKVYVVRRGDSLYRIARKFKTSIRKIASVNSLSNYRIYPEQKLYIPTQS